MILPPLPSSPDENATAPSKEVSMQPTHELSVSSKPRIRPFGRATVAKKGTSKSVAQRSKDKRLPVAKAGSVFDRLYKHQTAASRSWAPVRKEAHKGRYAVSATSKTSNTRRARTMGKSASLDDSLQIFQRLHITGTVATSSKRVSPKYPFTPERKKRTPEKSIPIMKTPLRSASKKTGVSYMYSPRMKPLTKIYFDSKYHPGIGVQTVDPVKLGNSFFQLFCEYENRGLSTEQLARELIIAFFKKDFPSGR